MHYVYRNLHKARWSVKNKAINRVTMHRKNLVMSNCVFWVSQSGRLRVIKSRQKNVHAMVRGSISREKIINFDGWVQISYNPYSKSVDRFYIVGSGNPVNHADKVVFTEDMRVYALNPTT